jgi:Mn2+/Fe2+ NRAMP family transporter
MAKIDGAHVMSEPRKKRFFSIIGPGLLVAATGVGAGDLATGAFSGMQLGTAVLWGVLVGAFLKFVITEGLARWQLATGKTFLEGAVEKLGKATAWIFLPYLVFWTFFVSAALMSACGAATHAMIPVFEDAREGKIAFGLLHSALGIALVLLGGYRVFERVMSACIGIMFLTVVTTAVLLEPDWGDVLTGLFVPSRSTLTGDGLTWTIALIGGVGGTVTVLCYGYWIREEGRSGFGAMRDCRIDLGVGYTMTALFGIAMVIIGSHVDAGGKGANLIVSLANVLEAEGGATLKWIFLVGAWGAVFSSLLGVWQAVPYIFADVWRLLFASKETRGRPIDTRSKPYRIYLIALAVIPTLWLGADFKVVQKTYAVIGACFIPLCAVGLLLLAGRKRHIGEEACNRWPSAVVLLAAVALFAWFVATKVSGLLASLGG